jgi:uncharacterized damage-inducible protein DinB
VSEFDEDLEKVTSDLAEARARLLAIIEPLQEDDLSRRRRGGWSVRDVLLHVIGGERHYAAGVAHIRGHSAADHSPTRNLRTAADAVRMLEASRGSLLLGVQGIDEEAFYRLAKLSNEEGVGQTYSVLTLLENIANHDREHAAQIEAILVNSPRG